MKELKILNVFGIKPTNNYTSAGMDMYIPDINYARYSNDLAYRLSIIDAWKKSYKTEASVIDYYEEEFCQMLKDYVEEERNQVMNIVQLFLAIHSNEIETLSAKYDIKLTLTYFFHKYIVFDEKTHVAGVIMGPNDTLCINSGLKVALHPGTAGIMFNKSGRGNNGWDTRACVVDEDYSGYVHLSMAYTKDTEFNNVIYCGDKLVQMVVLPVLHLDPVEVSEKEYDDIMKDSQRGANAFGSGDAKH